MTITEFLEARIAEDEAVARSASPGPWSFSDIDSIGGGTIYDPTVAIANVEWDNEHVDARIRRTRPNWQADATGVHIARHDPSRVLAECAAKRAVISNVGPYSCSQAHPQFDVYHPDGHLSPVIRALASVYKDHADYQEEWA